MGVGALRLKALRVLLLSMEKKSQGNHSVTSDRSQNSTSYNPKANLPPIRFGACVGLYFMRYLRLKLALFFGGGSEVGPTFTATAAWQGCAHGAALFVNKGETSERNPKD